MAHYRDKILPTLLATWAVWIPLMAIIYSLPLALQFPLFGLALSFWVLLLITSPIVLREKLKPMRRWHWPQRIEISRGRGRDSVDAADEQSGGEWE